MASAPTLRLVPCTVTNLSPLQVLLADGSTVTGLRLPSASYSVGTPAVALLAPPALTVILPIGV